MSEIWHEQIQRCLDGRATAEEFSALQRAMKDDACLCGLYLDYANLDVALEDAATRSPVRSRKAHSPRWWLAAAAALAVLFGFMVFPRQRTNSAANSEISAAIASTQAAIARLSTAPVSETPIWSSPTDSLIAQPDTAPATNRTP